MKLLKRIPFMVAVKTILVIAVVVFFFHILVVTGIVPYANVWGGRLQSQGQMLIFETISIIINLLILLVVLIRGGLVRQIIPNKIIQITMWVLAILFTLNTLGNLVSLSSLEAILATPVTLVLAIMFLRLALYGLDKSPT
jgi:hypothetical protein